MASAQVCPVVGTTNTVLPPQHPAFDINKPGQVCPVTLATTDHHNNLSEHPPVEIPKNEKPSNAAACPALKAEVKQPEAKKLDDEVCPVVGTATSVLPPDHPDMKNSKPGDVCPKTNATLGSHQGLVQVHPPVSSNDASKCPVVGAQA